MPISAPIKKAKNSATAIFGQPNINPMKNANFTSPKPIPLPFVMSTIAKKKAEVANPDESGFNRLFKLEIRNSKFEINPKLKIQNIKTKIIPAIIISSGIIKYLRSETKMTIKQDVRDKR